MEKNSMDNLFEELLKESASQAAKELGEEILESEGMELSQEHRQEMEKLFAKYRRKERKIPVFLTRTAVCAASVILVFTVVFNADAVKFRFLNMFTNTNPTNTEISFLDGTSYSNSKITVGYVPEDFELETESITNNRLYLKFRRDEEYFKIEVGDSYGKARVDTENSDTEPIERNGVKMFFTKKEDLNILSYYVDERAVKVWGNIEKDLLIKIAEHIKFN